MTSLRTLLHGTRPGLARLVRSWFSRPDATRQNLAVHHKVVLLGTWLLASCLAVAGLGIWGVMAIHSNHVELARREVPALTLLLQIDTDLYQAQLGLERAAGATDALQRKAGWDFFADNVSESEHRFTTYKTLTLGGEKEAAAIRDYGDDRAKWLHATEEQTRAIASIRASDVRGGEAGEKFAEQKLSPGATDFELTRGLFEKMREDLNRIILDVYQPAIESSASRADRNAEVTCWKVLGGVLLAFIAGVTLTRNMARALKTQQEAAESILADREMQNQRQILEARLSRGLEMTQDEPATLKLVEEAIRLGSV